VFFLLMSVSLRLKSLTSLVQQSRQNSFDLRGVLIETELGLHGGLGEWIHGRRRWLHRRSDRLGRRRREQLSLDAALVADPRANGLVAVKAVHFVALLRAQLVFTVGEHALVTVFADARRFEFAAKLSAESQRERALAKEVSRGGRSDVGDRHRHDGGGRHG